MRLWGIKRDLEVIQRVIALSILDMGLLWSHADPVRTKSDVGQIFATKWKMRMLVSFDRSDLC